MIGKLTCPECKEQDEMEIPKTSCQESYVCSHCGTIIEAKKSCCVFCDYGDSKCPASEEHSRG